MFTPFAMNHSPLGLAAIQAQDESYQPPAADALLSGGEWIERYLLPLAGTDLLADHLRPHARVVAVGKEEILKGDTPGEADRGDWSFRILSRDAAGTERMETYDGVLDCTGVFMRSNWLGHGGIPLGVPDRRSLRAVPPPFAGMDDDVHAAGSRRGGRAVH